MYKQKEVIGDATLYLGDCLEILPTLNGINLYITSPPYNQSIQSFKPSGMHKETKWVNRISNSYYDTLDESEYQENQIKILNMCFEIAEENASFFYNHKIRWRDTIPIFPIEWLQKSKWIMRQEIIWARDGSVVQNARMFPPSDERIYWMRKNAWKWNRSNPKWLSVWQIPSYANSDHPVAFPLELPNRGIKCVSDHGDVICDPFMGSGTTGVACMNLGRKFIGIEIEERYFQIACERIDQAQKQGRLFE